jgi:phosphoribosylaminoimidazolecarboxamide formyltransferase/IMP cyclohydrolase
MTIKKALIEVQDRTGLVKFATNLIENGVELFAYDKTAAYLKKHKIPYSQIDNDVPEGWDIVDEEHIVGTDDRYHVDLIVVNLPDIEPIINKIGQSQIDVLNQIDISTISNIRLAAKNYDKILPIITNTDYGQLIDDIQTGKLDDMKYRSRFAQKVFGYTSKYDSMISQYLYLNSL